MARKVAISILILFVLVVIGMIKYRNNDVERIEDLGYVSESKNRYDKVYENSGDRITSTIYLNGDTGNIKAASWGNVLYGDSITVDENGVTCKYNNKDMIFYNTDCKGLKMDLLSNIESKEIEEQVVSDIYIIENKI